jgi:lipoprotein-releasing system permease protein
MEQIRQVAGDDIEGMTPTVVVPAMLSYEFNGSSITRPVQLIGIDERTQSQVGDFCNYLQHPSNREKISFELRESGYDVNDHQAGPVSPPRPDMAEAGWTHRRKAVERQRMLDAMQPQADRGAAGFQDPFAAPVQLTAAGVPISETTDQNSAERLTRTEPPLLEQARDGSNPLRGAAAAAMAFDDVPSASPDEAVNSTPEGAPQDGTAESSPPPADSGQPAVAATVAAEEPAAMPKAEAKPTAPAADPFAQQAQPAGETFDPLKEQHPGAVLGIATVTHPLAAGKTLFLAVPGDDVRLSFPTAGTPPEVSHASFTVVDLYESKMSEYDASFVFVPIEVLQQYRGMFDPETKIGYATSIQIKLRPGADGNTVRDKLRAAFAPQVYNISTWRDKQGPLLAAVQMETAILNVLLFMIIFVAGFGILAIFFMIVVEKTRDIGILKALGASRRGILGIFLGYGLSLGIVGAGAGMVIGLLFVAYINEIADLLGMITGQEVFDPSIYYFQQIPTIVEIGTVTWIVAGALAIAVLASVLPARRAARLHPVEALRYE